MSYLNLLFVVFRFSLFNLADYKHRCNADNCSPEYYPTDSVMSFYCQYSTRND